MGSVLSLKWTCKCIVLTVGGLLRGGLLGFRLAVMKIWLRCNRVQMMEIFFKLWQSLKLLFDLSLLSIYV